MSKFTKEEIHKLGEIYKDILAIDIGKNDTQLTLLNKFHKVMLKWGIAQGNKTKHGSVTLCTPEWNLFFNVFKVSKLMAFDLLLLLHEPDDIEVRHYGDKIIDERE